MNHKERNFTSGDNNVFRLFSRLKSQRILWFYNGICDFNALSLQRSLLVSGYSKLIR